MEKSTIDGLVARIKYYSDLSQEVETPCEHMLRELGDHGLDAVAKLMRESLGGDDESVPSYCAQLITTSDLPGTVEVLTGFLVEALSRVALPDETLGEIFNYAVNYDRFLSNPQFLSAARELSRRWNNFELDQFLMLAEERLK